MENAQRGQPHQAGAEHVQRRPAAAARAGSTACSRSRPAPVRRRAARPPPGARGAAAPSGVGQREQADGQPDQHHHQRRRAVAPSTTTSRPVRCTLPLEFLSPACGPLPVTTVPTTSTAAVDRDGRPRPAAAPRRCAGAPAPASARSRHHSSERHRDDRHRQQEVQRDQPRVEVGQHGDAAEHGLRRDAERGERWPARARGAAPSRRASVRERDHAERRRSAAGCVNSMIAVDRVLLGRGQRASRCTTARSGSPARSR